jgi:hypothetical protein
VAGSRKKKPKPGQVDIFGGEIPTPDIAPVITPTPIELLMRAFPGSWLVDHMPGNGRVPNEARFVKCPECETTFTRATWPVCRWCGFRDYGKWGD